MRGIVFIGERQLELREFPEPKPGFAEVIIEMRASGLCGSDFRAYRAPRSERGDPALLKASGHEPCGQVVEVGTGIRNVKVGDRVMVHHYLGCGCCRWCQVGYSQMCIDPGAKKLYYGRTNHGGHAERIAVHETACVPMPDGFSYEEGAACACGTGTAYDAVKRLELSGRDTFAIYGQGPVGLSAALFGVATGARVIAVEPVAYRRELAKSLGCDVAIDPRQVDPVEVINELTHGEGADATLDCTGIPEPRVNTIRSTRIYGRACFVGEGGETSFDISRDIIHKQLTIHGSWTMSTLGLGEVAKYVTERKLPLRKLITHRFRLEQAAEAYKIFESGQTGKAVFTWD
ncbi:MAG: zinc-binding dehydrogenase [Betaproteobacteria bacterium]|nr:zinc-binding dehydrogenase [Betaproteobacteria bacterium]